MLQKKTTVLRLYCANAGVIQRFLSEFKWKRKRLFSVKYSMVSPTQALCFFIDCKKTERAGHSRDLKIHTSRVAAGLRVPETGASTIHRQIKRDFSGIS